jgi:hypothetical protein
VAYAAVNLGRLVEADAGTLITPDVLAHDGLVRRSKTKSLPVKILGGGDAPKGVTIHAHAFSRAALDKLAAAGSTAQRISWPEGNPVDEAAEAAAAAAAEAEAETRRKARGKRKGKKAASQRAAAAASPAAEADAPVASGPDAQPAASDEGGAEPQDDAGSEPEEANGKGEPA